MGTSDGIGKTEAVIHSRPSAVDARRVNHLVMRGSPISDTDRPIAEAIVGRYDGVRGQYWPAAIILVVAVLSPILGVVLRAGTHHSDRGWIVWVWSALLILCALRWVYTVNRVRRFKTATRRGPWPTA